MIRKTSLEDYAQVAKWLSEAENLKAHTGSDLSWADYDPEVPPGEPPALVQKHLRAHTMVDENDEICGVVFTYPTHSYPWVWNLEIFISPQTRKSGHGFSLLQFAIEDLFTSTFCEVLEGTIAEDNVASIAAFKKFGEVVVGRIPDYFPRVGGEKVAAIRVAMTRSQWNG